MKALRGYTLFAGIALTAAASVSANETGTASANGTVAETEDELAIDANGTVYTDSTEQSDYVPVPEEAVLLSGGQNGVHRKIIGVLYDASDLHFQDATVPRFLMIDRQGNTLFGIGGYVEGVAQYDFGGAIDNSGFITNDISVPSNPGMRNRLAADATHTNIVLQLLRKTPLGVLSAYVQGNFSAADYGFKLKQAYLRLDKVTMGYTRSTFEDALAGAPTIDYQGPAGAVSRTNVILQYRTPVSRHFSVAVSAEIPDADYTLTPGANEDINQRFPDIPVYVQYQWGEHSHVRASALLRDLSYRNLVSGENKFATGWGVQLSGIADFSKFVALRYEVVYGKGIANYINDLSGFGYDLLSKGEGGGMKAPGSFSMSSGLQVNISKKLFVSGTYSFVRLYDQGNMGGDFYRRGNYAVVNCFYTPFDSFQVGLEYLHGIRTNMNHEHGSANRLEAMVKYSF